MTIQSGRAARHRRRNTEGFFEEQSTASSSSPVSRPIWYKEPKLLAGEALLVRSNIDFFVQGFQHEILNVLDTHIKTLKNL